MRSIRPLLAVAIALNVAAAPRSVQASNDALDEKIKFPEYDTRTACVEQALIPDRDCVRKEITTRALLLSTWATIDAQYGAAASTCIALLAHPDAAPASYSKLLACIAGELYAAE